MESKVLGFARLYSLDDISLAIPLGNSRSIFASNLVEILKKKNLKKNLEVYNDGFVGGVITYVLISLKV